MYRHTSRVAGIAMLLGMLSACSIPQYALKLKYTQEVKELCAQNTQRIFVYETRAELPRFHVIPGSFYQKGLSLFGDPEYELKRKEIQLKGDKPEAAARIVKLVTSIYSRIDGKLLGESINFSQAGGDTFTRESFKFYYCVAPSQLEQELLRAVFKENK